MKKILLQLMALAVLQFVFQFPAFAANTFENDFRDQTPVANKSDIVVNKMQTLFDASDAAPTYIGFAKRGKATSDDAWRILKFTYSGSNVTAIKTADGVWDDRASLTYA